jgi:tRNA1(Val) A37 N6-methylase TrmN6
MNIAKQIRSITKEDAILSFEKLKELNCNVNPGLNNAGIKALDYIFLKHRIKAKTKSGISFYDAIRNKKLSKNLLKYVKRWKNKTIMKKNMVNLKYDVFQLIYGSVNQFRPTIAKWLYCLLGAKKGILDISAGWGGRCLAAISLGVPYIGIDANTNLKKSYEQMIKMYACADADAGAGAGTNHTNNGSKVKMIFSPAEKVDFSKFDYDLIFTSPPYFTLEKYENMPAYGSKKEFLDVFFIPVILSAWRYLKVGGKMALNMPEEMFEAIRDYLPKLSKKIYMKLKSRDAGDKVQRGGGDDDSDVVGGSDVMEGGLERGEYIFVWTKTARAARAATNKTKKVITNKANRTRKN